MGNELLRSKERILAIDALRGFAVMGIILLHNIEHFNYYSFPKTDSPLLASLDKHLWDMLFFLFSGKAYAIFALLFGFTFYLQSRNCEKRGEDFRNRYMWRLVLLLGFGFINASFFPGEILVLYALLGFVLVPVRHLSDKTVFWIACFLMLQPLEWCKVIYALINPEANPQQMIYSLGDVYPQLGGSSWWEMVKVNFVTGQLASLNWAWCYGRVFQNADRAERLVPHDRRDTRPGNGLLATGRHLRSAQCGHPLLPERLYLFANQEPVPESFDGNHLELLVQLGFHARNGQRVPHSLLGQ